MLIMAAIKGPRKLAVPNTPDVGDGGAGGSYGDRELYADENVKINVPRRRPERRVRKTQREIRSILT